jgi:hypothetical protein
MPLSERKTQKELRNRSYAGGPVGETLGGRYGSAGPKITATRPLQPTPIDDSGVPKPKPIPSVHSRTGAWRD